MVEVYVSKLRKLVSGDVLVTLSPGYLLRADPEQFDIARFERLFAEGHEVLERGEATTATARLGEALALWRGPALVDFAISPSRRRRSCASKNSGFWPKSSGSRRSRSRERP